MNKPIQIFLVAVTFIVGPLTSRADAVVPSPDAGAAADTPATADVPNWNDDTLSGDWGGLRTRLYQQGVTLGMTHKSDLLANTRGGIKTGSGWMAHSEARLALDLDKLWGVESANAFFLYHSNLGSKLNQTNVGAFVGVDNIEVNAATAQFFDAWVQKSWFNERLSLLAGLYPVDAEFYVTDTSAVFLQPPYGMANDLAQTGINGPPIFPLGALALRMKYTTPGKNCYLMGALTDGVPGDPNNPRGTHIQLNKGDGSFGIVEFGYTPQSAAAPEGGEEGERFNKTAVGFWRYSATFPDFAATETHKSQGAYVLAERSLMTEAGHPAQGLAGFVRYGVATDAVNTANWTGSLGLRYRGLLDGRDQDLAGLSVTINHAGNAFRNSGSFEREETDYEATYRMQLRPWFALQPDVQYIVNPGFDPALKNAVVAGVRAEIEF